MTAHFMTMISPTPTASVPEVTESLLRKAAVKRLAVNGLRARIVSELQFTRSRIVE
jgi:hypothetical protein